MTELELVDLVKIYPFAKVSGMLGRKRKAALLEKQRAMPYTTNEGVVAVQHFSAKIPAGEFLVLLGPSGCGKTTLLRMIAGLEEPTLGEVRFDGKRMNGLPPEEHDVAMVFQNYSLYPHLNVYDNIAFPLRTTHMPREELDQAVVSMAELLGLRACLVQRPSELSGGQLQRVAIARALVRRPQLFLLDEPFSNLDPPLRAALRTELKRIHATVGTTFIYVTHDQLEALSLGTRILVMKDGLLLQDGTPREVYNRPVNLDVAAFVGAPAMNLFHNLALSEGGTKLRFPWGEVSLPEPVKASGRISAGFRPVHVQLGSEGFPAKVERVEPMGAETLVHLSAGGCRLCAVTMQDSPGQSLMRGAELRFRVPEDRLHLFDQNGKRIG